MSPTAGFASPVPLRSAPLPSLSCGPPRVCALRAPTRMVLSPPEKDAKGRFQVPLRPAPDDPTKTNKASSSEDKNTPPLRLTGNNVPLTDSLRDYVTNKLKKLLTRYNGVLTKVDVHLTVEHNPSIANGNKAEVVAFAGKTILRNEVRAEDMYAAIDLVQDRFARTLRKYKERRDDAKSSKNKQQVDMPVAPLSVGDEEDEETDEFLDDETYKTHPFSNEGVAPGLPNVNEIVRRKVFPMPLQTVQEAVLCCEYVDHPWYLFRNAENNEICLVYKRNHGGYGLIEPSNPNGKDDEPVM